MKIFRYDEQTYDLLDYLKAHTPKRIVSDEHMSVVFDYEEFHLQILPDDEEAATQNKFDEAIIARVNRVDSIFQPRDDEKTLFEATPVNRIWILRTVLYFSGEVIYSDEDRVAHRAELPADTEPVLTEVLSNLVSGHDEVILHPKSEDAKHLDESVANLVEAGFVFEMDDHALVCCPVNNAFYLHGKVMSPEELSDQVAPFYEFVPVQELITSEIVQ